MQRLGACIIFIAILPLARADEPRFPGWGTEPRFLGGLVIIREGNTTTTSVGGIVLPRKVKVTTNTPEGPIVARFKLPSALHSENNIPLPGSGPASLWIDVPDSAGVLYVNGELISGDGRVRSLQSPLLAPGVACPIQLRFAFRSGDNLVYEDCVVVLHADDHQRVVFDGSRAISVVVQWP